MHRHYNYNNSHCRTCGSWVWKGDGVWSRGWTYCLACWQKKNTNNQHHEKENDYVDSN